MPGMMIEVRGLTKLFHDDQGRVQRVIDGVDWHVEAGAAVRLNGPSGAGKSTFLNLLSGLLPPDEGQVRLGDTQLSQLSEARRDRFRAAHVGYIFQTFNLLTPLSVLENLVIPLRLAGNNRRGLDDQARGILERFGLGDHAHKRPYHLSVGQRQRVAAARAILMQPDILLADEPTASLDPDSAQAVVEALKDLNGQGTTLVLASHDPALKEFATQAVLELGRKEVAA